MKHARHYMIKALYIMIDVICLYCVMYAACLLRQQLISFPITFTGLILDPQNPFRHIIALWILTTIFSLNGNSLYQTRREVLEGIEIWLVVKSVIVSSIVTTLGIYALKLQGFPRTVFFAAAVGMVVVLSLWRVLKRIFVEYLVAQGYNNFNVVIIGAGKVGVALLNEIHKQPGLGIRVVGFLDDFRVNNPKDKDIKILGKISDFTSIAPREFVNKIFITIHHDGEAFLNLLEQARDLGIAVRVVPQGFDLTTGEFVKYNIGFIPILEYSDVQIFRKQAGKRLFDFFLSVMGLIVLFPVFVVIAVLVKLDSSGPVYYASRRYGRGGQVFHMYKFRSMVRDADKALHKLRDKNEVDGPIFKMKKDPRITKFGRFLRRYSLDELPQIINVLKGEMSFVGPRPLPIDQVERDDLLQLKRLEVRPGITGLWQIRGRSDISFLRLVKWDIWYINNWSFWLDLNILLQTVPVVLKGRGAY